jgi:hypothetical protein
MTVRISDKLIGQVVETITNLYRKRFEEFERQRPVVGDRLYELAYGPYLSSMEAIPAGFLPKGDVIEVSKVGDRKIVLRFPLSGRRLVGMSHPSNENMTADDYGRFEVVRTPMTEEIVDGILSWRKQIDDTMEIRENGQKAVRTILKRYVSLPPAIKAFPPLVELLPAAARGKTDVPQHKLTSAEMELNPHLKQLATDIALSKFLNR